MMSMQSLSRARLDAAELVARVLNEADAGWGVMHGAEDYPKSVGRDLDILVAPKDVLMLGHRIASALTDAGWEVSMIRRPWCVCQIIASRDIPVEGVVAFEADLVGYQSWRGIALAKGPAKMASLYYREEVIACDAWAGFVKRILIQCLAANWPKMEARRHEWALHPKECELVPARLATMVGEDCANCFMTALCMGDFEKLKLATHFMRGRLLKALLHGKVKSALGRWLADKCFERLLWRTHAPLVIFFYPDDWSCEYVIAKLSERAADCRRRLVFPSVRVQARDADFTFWDALKFRRQSAMGDCVLLGMKKSSLGSFQLPDWSMVVSLTGDPDNFVYHGDWLIDGGGGVKEEDFRVYFNSELMRRTHALNRS